MIIEPSWDRVLDDWMIHTCIPHLLSMVKRKRDTGVKIWPQEVDVFTAFKMTPFHNVKVVIIGQDPYHTPGMAMGLSFSVPRGIKVPPSLKNVYKELSKDVGFEAPFHGNLSSWAAQGVLLLNTILTVEEGKAGSHKKLGWGHFTDVVIQSLSDLHEEGIVFLLWGKYAQTKEVLIDSTKHHVLKAAHPSPLARNAFQGCMHFSKTNEILLSQGQEAINWQLPD